LLPEKSTLFKVLSLSILQKAQKTHTLLFWLCVFYVLQWAKVVGKEVDESFEGFGAWRGLQILVLTWCCEVVVSMCWDVIYWHAGSGGMQVVPSSCLHIGVEICGGYSGKEYHMGLGDGCYDLANGIVKLSRAWKTGA